MERGFELLKEFLVDWELDIHLPTIKQHQLDNLDGLFAAEVHSCWDNIQDDRGIPHLGAEHAESMVGVFRAWEELKTLEYITQKVFEVGIWISRNDGQVECLEMIEIDREEGLFAGDDKFSQRVRKYANDQLNHPQWKEVYEGYESVVYYRVYGNSLDHYLFDISSGGEPPQKSLEDILKDYALWVGHSAVEGNRDVSPMDYVREAIEQDTLQETEVRKILREFYTEKTTEASMIELFPEQ